MVNNLSDKVKTISKFNRIYLLPVCCDWRFDERDTPVIATGNALTKLPFPAHIWFKREMKMKIIWLGHSGFRMEIAGQVLLIDPWLEGNPSFPAERRDEAIRGASAILLSHGHGDHASSWGLARELGVPIVTIYDLSQFLETQGVECVGFNKGGKVMLGDVEIHMVNACHSSTFDFNGDQRVAGSEAGFMIKGENHCIYFSGDTTIMADMEWMGEYYAPDIGILCAGGHFTMDMKMAAWASKRSFNFNTVIPCHYKTFPILEQNTDDLVKGLPDVEVLTPEVMEIIDI